jgi:hypothetical protein
MKALASASVELRDLQLDLRADRDRTRRRAGDEFLRPAARSPIRLLEIRFIEVQAQQERFRRRS